MLTVPKQVVTKRPLDHADYESIDHFVNAPAKLEAKWSALVARRAKIMCDRVSMIPAEDNVKLSGSINRNYRQILIHKNAKVETWYLVPQA